MKIILIPDGRSPDHAVHRLVDEFGARATLAALLRHIWRKRRTKRAAPRARDLPDWILRDIGLPPKGPHAHSARERPGPGLF